MSEAHKLLLIGGGGHCRSVLDSALSAGYKEIGIIDNNALSSSAGVPVMGNDDDLLELRENGWTDAFISVGSVGSTALRCKLYKMVKEMRFIVPDIIDPTAVIARQVNIEEGVFIGKNVVVNAGSVIGTCAILNTGAIIEHDCTVGAFSHISPGTKLCGQVSVGNDSHIGAGSVVRQCISIGNGSLIGIGSVVVKDMPDNVKAFGNPCKVVGNERLYYS